MKCFFKHLVNAWNWVVRHCKAVCSMLVGWLRTAWSWVCVHIGCECDCHKPKPVRKQRTRRRTAKRTSREKK